MMRALLAGLITTAIAAPTISRAEPDTRTPPTPRTAPDARTPTTTTAPDARAPTATTAPDARAPTATTASDARAPTATTASDARAPSATRTDLRMPPGTRTDAQGQLVSGRGLRDTSDFFAKELARRGIAADQIGPYGVRGVELTRFLSQTPSTPWLAIHVLRTGGKTLIFLISRPKVPPTP